MPQNPYKPLGTAQRLEFERQHSQWLKRHIKKRIDLVFQFVFRKVGTLFCLAFVFAILQVSPALARCGDDNLSTLVTTLLSVHKAPVVTVSDIKARKGMVERVLDQMDKTKELLHGVCETIQSETSEMTGNVGGYNAVLSSQSDFNELEFALAGEMAKSLLPLSHMQRDPDCARFFSDAASLYLDDSIRAVDSMPGGTPDLKTGILTALRQIPNPGSLGRDVVAEQIVLSSACTASFGRAMPRRLYMFGLTAPTTPSEE